MRLLWLGVRWLLLGVRDAAYLVLAPDRLTRDRELDQGGAEHEPGGEH